MKRKVIKLGDTTHVISLPASWVKDHDLSAGEELEVEVKGPVLRISTKRDVNLGRITLNLQGLSKAAIAEHLRAAYIGGYGEIELVLGESGAAKTLQDIFSSMIGFEIVEQNKNKLLIKDMSYEGELSPSIIMRKCFTTVLSVAEEGLKAVREGNFVVLKELKERDFIVNRFVDFYLRKIIQGDWVVGKNPNILFSFITLLEELGDHYSNFCEELGNLNGNLRKEILDTWENMNKLVETLYQNFFEFNNEAVVMILDSKRTLTKRIEKIMKEGVKENGVNDLIVGSWLKKIGATCSDLALHELLLNI